METLLIPQFLFLLPNVEQMLIALVVQKCNNTPNFIFSQKYVFGDNCCLTFGRYVYILEYTLVSSTYGSYIPKTQNLLHSLENTVDALEMDITTAGVVDTGGGISEDVNIADTVGGISVDGGNGIGVASAAKTNFFNAMMFNYSNSDTATIWNGLTFSGNAGILQCVGELSAADIEKYVPLFNKFLLASVYNTIDSIPYGIHNTSYLLSGVTQKILNVKRKQDTPHKNLKFTNIVKSSDLYIRLVCIEAFKYCDVGKVTVLNSAGGFRIIDIVVRSQKSKISSIITNLLNCQDVLEIVYMSPGVAVDLKFPEFLVFSYIVKMYFCELQQKQLFYISSYLDCKMFMSLYTHCLLMVKHGNLSRVKLHSLDISPLSLVTGECVSKNMAHFANKTFETGGPRDDIIMGAPAGVGVFGAYTSAKVKVDLNLQRFMFNFTKLQYDKVEGFWESFSAIQNVK